MSFHRFPGTTHFMVTAVFVAAAIVTAVGALVGVRLALNPMPPDRPAWLGWLMFLTSLPVSVLAIVFAVTAS